jgi:flagellar biosynthesis/type III secretory pathway protein FliH
MMAEALTMIIPSPITSVEILEDYASTEPARSPEVHNTNENSVMPADGCSQIQDSQSSRAELEQTCEMLQGVIDKLNRFYDTIFSGHKEEIAKLAVEIAGKILIQKIEDGDYKIESIIREALSQSPTQQDIVLHLNPEDFSSWQKFLADSSTGPLEGVKFVADRNIGRAECLLETPKGTIESFIGEQLEKIAGALKKTA